MSEIVRLPRHVLHGTRLSPCTLDQCMLCDGGLALCLVCRGAEGALPSDCPGEPMTERQDQDVYDGFLDYDARRGWVCRSNVDESRRRRGQ